MNIKYPHLKLNSWESNVKTNLNKLIEQYRFANNYVVFDFDNTCSIFDTQTITLLYQLETMAYTLTPDELKNILLKDINPNRIISGFGFFKEDNKDIRYSSLISDIYKSYSYLYSTYGPFNSNGLRFRNQIKIKSEDAYIEFSTKYILLIRILSKIEDYKVACFLGSNMFSGMNKTELYALSKKALLKYKRVKPYVKIFKTDGKNSLCGACVAKFSVGIGVSKNIKELFKTLYLNNIDIYICSASTIDIVLCAVDVFGLHKYTKGVLGMTNNITENKYVPSYDYLSGYGYFADRKPKWKVMDYPTKAATFCEGKVTSILNTIYKKYNKGPVACFGDSIGDFNMATEFESCKLFVLFNTGRGSLINATGLLLSTALFEANNLKYNLDKASSNHDTLYLIQGRDEHSLDLLVRNKEARILGNNKFILSRHNNINCLYEYALKNNLSVKELINTFSLINNQNIIKDNFGFLDSYNGYHNIKDK